MIPQNILGKLDKLGMTASTACAIHCALVPLLISFLPLWGLSFLAEEWVELGMIGLAVILGLMSLGFSYMRHHRRGLPLLILSAGFVLVFTGHFFGTEMLEPVLIPLGGFIIAAAHFANWRFMRSCSHHHNPE